MLLKFFINVFNLQYVFKINNFYSYIVAFNESEIILEYARIQAQEYEQFIAMLQSDQQMLNHVVKEMKIQIKNHLLLDTDLKEYFLSRSELLSETLDVKIEKCQYILNEMTEIYQNKKHFLPKISKAVYNVLVQFRNDARLTINISKFISFFGILREIKKTKESSKKYNVAKRKYIQHSYRPDEILEVACKKIKEVMSKFASITRKIDLVLIYQKYKQGRYLNISDEENTISDIKFFTSSLKVILECVSLLLDDITKFNQITSKNVFAILNNECKEMRLNIQEELNKEKPNYLNIYSNENMGVIFKMISLILDLGSYTLNNYMDCELDEIIKKIEFDSENLYKIRENIRYISNINIFSNLNICSNILFKILKDFITFPQNEQYQEEEFHKDMIIIFHLLAEYSESLNIFIDHIKVFLF